MNFAVLNNEKTEQFPSIASSYIMQIKHWPIVFCLIALSFVSSILNIAVYILKTTVYTLKAYTIKTMKHDPCIIRSIVIDKLYFDRKQNGHFEYVVVTQLWITK